MTVQASDQLQVLVIGVDAPAARDVVRLIVSDGAAVVAVDSDAAKLSLLERDLGDCGAPIETAQIDLADPAEVELWGAALTGLGRRPHLIICCCGEGPGGPVRQAGPGLPTQPADVSLAEHRPRACPALVAERILQPALCLHAQALRATQFDRGLAVIRHPTLCGLLACAPGRGRFDPDRATAYARLASESVSVRRPMDGEPLKGGRLRLVPPSDKPPGRANAA